MIKNIHKSWESILPLLYKDPLLTLNTKILPNIQFEPKKSLIFRVFQMDLMDIKVVILGQDPYPSGKAVGKAFAVNKGIKLPKSLVFIEKEVSKDFNTIKNWRTLDHWESQGVFLFNTALTVEKNKPNSHAKYWKKFCDNAIRLIAIKNPCIWMLWGNLAKNKKSLIDSKDNTILEAGHPVTGYYGKDTFSGCNHFVKANNILQSKELKTINW